ncbi:ferritin-like domain-containing protein [Vallicoccus soli]|uniref:Ferritin-like domain-containing protein n=1 Tax=Vallicoccus soli TaxID=2339232 RepID=A0A3A3ZLM4_9ACTN|nr:ferritin-like domain-containing protein [Vallicoccus soli]RJK97092.1 ferritin-like domain-containing protein [Vallicoccus soli]
MPEQTPAILAELRTLLRLTEAEVQVAETRRAQARTEAVERELRQNAENARERARLVAAALRGRGGVPDVVTTVAGRLGATAKAGLEQAQPLPEALLGDLALEHQLQDRARYLKALATAADDQPLLRLAERLDAAHGATVDWLTTVLAEVALGGPAALRPTPLQAVVGKGLSLATLPARTLTRGLDDVAARAAGLRRRAEDRVDEVARTAGEVRGAVADVLVPEDELPVEGYDALSQQAVVKAVKQLRTPDEVRRVVAYEEAHRGRRSIVSAAQSRLAALAEEVVRA